MKLVIESVTLIDLTNKEAKRVEFSEGKNFLTSDGNHYGKSVVMKTIYYSLGAEVFYPTPIKKLNLLTCTCFRIDENHYKAYRLKNSFVLYINGRFEGKYNSVADFGNVLAEIFNFEIELVGKDTEGTITKCPPAFYFMPYYVDQENGWDPNSSSFNNMTQFDKPQRKDSYFFHLGVYDAHYVMQKKQQKTNDRQISLLTHENEKYLTVIETLRDGLSDTDMSFDVDDLESAIRRRKHEIDYILKEIAKIRSALVETEDRYFKVSNEKELLSRYIKKKMPVALTEGNCVECPRCGMFFQPANADIIEKIYLLESLNDDYTQKAQEFDRLEKKIAKLKNDFKERQKSLEKFEHSLKSDQDLYETYLKAKTTKRLLDEYRATVSKNLARIDELSDSNKSLKDTLATYQDERKVANNAYLQNLYTRMIGLDIPRDQVEENTEPGTSMDAAGAYGPRCKVAQILSFVETQNEIAHNILSFPIVIDSPNIREQDKKHLSAVLKTLFDWSKTDNQIIVASIEGKEIAANRGDVKVIDVTGKVNHIMDENDYKLIEDQISEIMTRF